MSKKFFTFILSLAIVINFSFSQSGWFWQNPLPQGNYLKSQYYLNSQTAYVVGGCGTVLKTQNGGLNWMIQNTFTNKWLYSVSFLDSYAGFIGSEYITGGLTLMLKTTNSGNNWILQNTFINTGLGVERMQFANQYTGYMISAQIKKTTDGGLSWFNVKDAAVYQNFFFLNQDSGYVVGYPGLVSKTTNGGINWINLITNVYTRFLSIDFINLNTGIIVGRNDQDYTGVIMKTTDGGNNWQSIINNYPLGIFTVDMLNEMLAFCGGPNGLILKTTNGGLNWIPQTSNSLVQIEMVKVIDENNVSCIGGCGRILSTSNGGLNWLEYLPSNVKNISSIELINAQIGYVVGNNGYIGKTTNSGNSWISQNSITSKNLNSIKLYNSNTGYIVGDSGLIIKTINGGVSWLLQSPLTVENIYSVSFINPNICVAGGGHYYGGPPFPYSVGKIFNTTNGGTNWIINSINFGFVIYCVQYVDSSTAFGCGNNSKIIKSTDCGINWEYQNVSSGNTYYFLSFKDINTGFVVGTNILKTTNGGVNWIIKSAPSYLYKSIFIINDFDLIVVGNNGKIIKSSNFGESWGEQISLTSNNLNQLKFENNFTGYAVGDCGTILKTTTGGEPIGVNPISNIIPHKFSLSQNYPNPFNPTTKIKFDIPAGNRNNHNVKVVIYDLLGREIAILVNEQLKAGTYEVDWDGSNYSSGVYFYKLIVRQAGSSTGDFVQTKKMVLIR